MDRFLRYGSVGQPVPASQTIVVQAPDPPSFIENVTLEARVACDPSGLPSLQATVRGRPVIQSSYGDGTDGFTSVSAPSLNFGVKVADDGLFLDTTGIQAGRVLTCTDNEGKAEWVDPVGPPPVIQSSIESNAPGFQARVACAGTGQQITASLNGQAVFRSDYAGGVGGFTTVSAPSLNNLITVSDTGLQVVAPGLTIDPVSKVLTALDAAGTCAYKFVTKIADSSNYGYTFVETQQNDVYISANYEAGPPGKLRIQSQLDSTPGNVLTYVDGSYGCEFQPLPVIPPIPPSPSIFTSNIDSVIGTIPSVLYPPTGLTSTASSWSATVDSTFLVSGATNILWALFDTFGTQVGPTVSSAITAAGAVVRIVHTYVFRSVSPSEVRATITSLVSYNTTNTVRNPARSIALDPANGMPFIRMQKSALATTVVTVSRSAYFNCLNWTAPPPVVAFSAMRMADDAAEPVLGTTEEWPDAKPAVMLEPEPEKIPVTLEGAMDAEVEKLSQLGEKLGASLIGIYKEGESGLVQRTKDFMSKLQEIYIECASLLQDCGETKRQKLI